MRTGALALACLTYAGDAHADPKEQLYGKATAKFMHATPPNAGTIYAPTAGGLAMPTSGHFATDAVPLNALRSVELDLAKSEVELQRLKMELQRVEVGKTELPFGKTFGFGVAGIGVSAMLLYSIIRKLVGQPLRASPATFNCASATASRGGSPVMNFETKADLEALAKECNPVVGFWDPLGCTNLDFWKVGTPGTIGYLRHAEIKHGRIAMAAFLGYCAQSTDFVSGPHNVLPFRGFEPGLTPPEQWDAIPLIGKVQIITFVGMLESYGEILDVHYTKGGKPGYYPPIKGARPEILLNLWDPFNFMARMTPEAKQAGLVKEINNGRLAMLGIFSLISEARVPGSVPVLPNQIPEYAGNIMVPFSGDFSILG